MPNFKEKVVFHFDISNYDKKKYIWLVEQLAKRMQSAFGIDIFEKIRTYDVYHHSNPSEDLRDLNASGLAYYNGDIAVSYYGDYSDWYVSKDVHVSAMELGHNAILKLLPGLSFIDEFNNLIHFGSNAAQNNDRTYLKMTYIYFRTIKEFFMLKPRKKTVIEYYILWKLILDMKKINEMIENGTAPIGQDEYWRVKESNVQLSQQLKEKGIIPGSICKALHDH